MRRTIFSEGEFYHLYNRGTDKRIIFTSQSEYRRFQAYLHLSNDVATDRATDMFADGRVPPLAEILKAKPRDKALVGIGAYCLMPNHFHLYVTPLTDGGISRFMHRLQTAYTMYFNKSHERTGALFQGTFKAQHVSRDSHAKYLFSYIHLNPAKLKDQKWKERGARDLAGLRDFIIGYPYSSLNEYRSGIPALTEPTLFPEYLQTVTEVSDHIDCWLRFRDENLEAKPRG